MNLMRNISTYLSNFALRNMKFSFKIPLVNVTKSADSNGQVLTKTYMCSFFSVIFTLYLHMDGKAKKNYL